MDHVVTIFFIAKLVVTRLAPFWCENEELEGYRAFNTFTGGRCWRRIGHKLSQISGKRSHLDLQSAEIHSARRSEETKSLAQLNSSHKPEGKKKERMPRKIIPVIRLDERGQQSAPANYLEYAKMNRPSDKIYERQRLSWTLESFPVTSCEERKRPWEIHLTLISSISRRTSVLSNFDPEHSPSSTIHPRL